MARAVHQGKLQTVIFSVPAGFTQVLREGNSKRTEPEIQSDASLFGLGVLVEGCGGRGAAQRPSKRRFAAVHMTEDTDVKIKRFGSVNVTWICHQYS